LSKLFAELLDTPDATVSRALELAEDIAANTSLVVTYTMREMVMRGPDNVEEAKAMEAKVIGDMYKGNEVILSWTPIAH